MWRHAVFCGDTIVSEIRDLPLWLMPKDASEVSYPYMRTYMLLLKSVTTQEFNFWENIPDANVCLAELLPDEIRWRDHCHFLESRGYKLPPRLRPGWEALGRTTGGFALSCEYGIILPVGSSSVCQISCTDSFVGSTQPC